MSVVNVPTSTSTSCCFAQLFVGCLLFTWERLGFSISCGTFLLSLLVLAARLTLFVFATWDCYCSCNSDHLLLFVCLLRDRWLFCLSGGGGGGGDGERCEKCCCNAVAVRVVVSRPSLVDGNIKTAFMMVVSAPAMMSVPALLAARLLLLLYYCVLLLAPTSLVTNVLARQSRPQQNNKLPFAVHNEEKDSTTGAVVAFEFEVYSRMPIGLTFNSTFHVTGFDDYQNDKSTTNNANAAVSRRRRGFSIAKDSGVVQMSDQLVRINHHPLAGLTFSGFSHVVKEAIETPPVSYFFRRRRPPPRSSLVSSANDDDDARMSNLSSGIDRSSGDSAEPLLHLWAASGSGPTTNHHHHHRSNENTREAPAGSPSPTSASISTSRPMLWTDLDQSASFEPAKFSGKVPVRRRFQLVEVSPEDGCSADLVAGVRGTTSADGHRSSSRRRRSRPRGGRQRSRDDDNVHSDSVNGSVVVVNRGGCAFDEKVHFAMDAGAAGIIVVNHDDSVLEMDSQHLSHFTERRRRRANAAVTPTAGRHRRRRRQSSGDDVNANVKNNRKSVRTEDVTETDADVFPVIGVTKSVGSELRRRLQPQQRRSISSVYVEFTLPRNHSLRLDPPAATTASDGGRLVRCC